jgi:hypothetical protein
MHAPCLYCCSLLTTCSTCPSSMIMCPATTGTVGRLAEGARPCADLLHRARYRDTLSGADPKGNAADSPALPLRANEDIFGSGCGARVVHSLPDIQHDCTRTPHDQPEIDVHAAHGVQWTPFLQATCDHADSNLRAHLRLGSPVPATAATCSSAPKPPTCLRNVPRPRILLPPAALPLHGLARS